MRPVVLGHRLLRRARELHGAPGDVGFRLARALRQLLDRVAVPIAGRKVHLRVRAGGILTQDLLDQADALEEQRPVDRGQQPHARDDVADGELIGSAPLMLGAQHLFRRVPLSLERPLQRAPRGRRRRRLITQPVQQLDNEWSRQPVVRADLLPKQLIDDLRRVLLALAERRPPAPRLIPAPPRGDDRVGEPLQLLDQREPKHDRDGPDLADRQRSIPLIRPGEVLQHRQVEAAGGVRDQLAGEDVHTRIALERTIRQLGQLAVVLPRQVLPDLSNLIADDVMVVPEPVFGADRLRVGPAGGRQEAVRVIELAGGFVQPREERTPAVRVAPQPMLGRQSASVRLELLLTEQLGRRRLICRQLGRNVSGTQRLGHRQVSGETGWIRDRMGCSL